MLPARTYSVSIAQDWRTLYERIWHPEFFPQWASGLSESPLRRDGEYWYADSPEATLRIRFTPHNEYGVMDHFVDIGDGNEIHIPLRIIQNGEGAEVMLTLFRQNDMDDERFNADAKWINKDLNALKHLVR